MFEQVFRNLDDILRKEAGRLGGRSFRAPFAPAQFAVRMAPADPTLRVGTLRHNRQPRATLSLAQPHPQQLLAPPLPGAVHLTSTETASRKGHWRPGRAEEVKSVRWVLRASIAALRVSSLMHPSNKCTARSPVRRNAGRAFPAVRGPAL